MALKLIICSLALPLPAARVCQFPHNFWDSMNFEVDLPRLLLPSGLLGSGSHFNAYFLLSKHTKQLLLVTFCDTPAGIEVNSDTRTEAEGQTDHRNGSRNSYLDGF